MFQSGICLILLAAFAAGVFAIPLPQQKVLDGHITKLGSQTTPNCYDINVINTRWFHDRVNPGYRGRFDANAMFYSKDMTKAARELARKLQLITIWEVWPDELYEESTEDWNPLSCIHKDKTLSQIYFEKMSRAYAEKAREGAMVLHSPENYDQELDKGIWTTVERPVLERASGPVNWIVKVKEESTKTRTYWDIWEKTPGDFQRWFGSREDSREWWLRMLEIDTLAVENWWKKTVSRRAARRNIRL